jgi:transposase, IS5 family
MTKQMELAQALLAPGFGRNARLEKIDALIDWAPLEWLMAPLHQAETGGRPIRRSGHVQGVAAAAVATPCN